jgi:hypothetical protein
MPVHKVIGPHGRPGYRWGDSGKIYYGRNAQEKAAKQGRAAWANGYTGKKK